MTDVVEQPVDVVVVREEYTDVSASVVEVIEVPGRVQVPPSVDTVEVVSGDEEMEIVLPLEVEVITAGQQGPEGVQGVPGPLAPHESVMNIDGLTLFPLTPVYMTGNGQVAKARADEYGKAEVVGLVVDTTPTNTIGLMQVTGVIEGTAAQWEGVTGEAGGLIPQASYFLANLAGRLVRESVPIGAAARTRVGVALSSTRMKLTIEPPIRL